MGGIIYLVRSQRTGKVFIGYTSRSLEDALRHSYYCYEAYKNQTALIPQSNAIYDILIDPIETEVLESVYDESDLKRRAIFWIQQYPNCINKLTKAKTTCESCGKEVNSTYFQRHRCKQLAK